MSRLYIAKSSEQPGDYATRSYRVVLAHLRHSHTPWVTWLMFEDADTGAGHYHATSMEAIGEYLSRCERYGLSPELPVWAYTFNGLSDALVGPFPDQETAENAVPAAQEVVETYKAMLLLAGGAPCHKPEAWSVLHPS